MWKYIFLILISAKICDYHCIHDHFAHTTQKHYFNDIEYQSGRMLQQQTSGNLRIFSDYNQLTIGSPTQSNLIKRFINITSSYFYNTLSVIRLNRLYFPSTQNLLCGVLHVNQDYANKGIIADLAVIVANQLKPKDVYVAKSTACAYLKSNSRPIWGMIIFNNAFLKYDQVGFQQNLFVAIHQMTHILGFSASMYSMYPNGNPLIKQQNGDYYLTSDALKRQSMAHFGCNTTKGILLQDQDGTMISSHWQRKIVGNQFMIASSKVNPFVSRFTLALLQTSGWYTNVNYTFAESTTWGKNKGCSFLNIGECDFPEFCSVDNFDCDWEGTTIGRCSPDLFTNSCKVIKYFTNTICVDESYQLKNLNVKLNAMEKGGSNSKCFISNFRQKGIEPNKLNNRCYQSVCSSSGKYLYVLIRNSILVCMKSGQKIQAPHGLIGTLTCPSNFDNYCKTKQSCPYHCNKNGACINGQCLCTGSKILTPSCLDISIQQPLIGLTGGLLFSLRDQSSLLSDEPPIKIPQKSTNYSIDQKCMTGTILDETFGECLQCQQVFNCSNCDSKGCLK